MTGEFRRGFKTWCENTSLGIRRDFGLQPNSALDPRVLCQRQGIVVWYPEEVAKLGNLDNKHLEQLIRHDNTSWSAVTLVLPGAKAIIINSTRSRERENSDIMHEVSHLILSHRPSRVDITEQGLMILDSYDSNQEAEANWLAGALLVPRDGLFSTLKRDLSDLNAAKKFEVSQQMIRMRRFTTGIDVQLKRRIAFG